MKQKVPDIKKQGGTFLMIMGIDEFMVVITIAMTIVKMYIHKNVDSSVFLVQPLFPGFPFLKKIT